LKAVLFDLGAGQRPVLFVVVHHLVVDGVSWRILLEDLDTAYQQAVRGETARLEAKTTSFREWARRLAEHAAAGGFDDQRDYWAGVSQGCDPVLPVDAVGCNTVTSTNSVTVRLGPEETRALLQDVPTTREVTVTVDEGTSMAAASGSRRWKCWCPWGGTVAG